MKPSGETTDSSTEATEVSTTTNADLPDEENDTATQDTNSDAVSDEDGEKANEDSENAGCSSVIGVYGVMIFSTIAATVCAQKARKENL
ncbi:MAG: hypothetical protein IJV72_05025 [Clostridia bacterium]|nr:hypothetical protein [Clostridia bacterium]